MRGMSPLTRPTGSEPERTYWVRRAVLAVAVVTSIALAGWVLSMLFGSNSATASPEPAPNDPTLASDAPVAPSATPTPSASASASASAARSASASASTSASKPATPSPTPTTPAAPQVCAATDVDLAVNGATSVKSGSPTSLSVAFTNKGTLSCKLDFSRTPLTLKIYSGTDRIWTSADCTSWAPTGVTPLPASKSFTFKEEWPTLRSAPGCKLRNIYLQPGTYVATAVLPGGQPAQLIMQLHG